MRSALFCGTLALVKGNRAIKRQVQQSYNWAYMTILGGARMLPFLAKGLGVDGRRPWSGPAKPATAFAVRLHDAGEEFRSLAVYLRVPALDSAARGLDEVACKIGIAITELSRDDHAAAARHFEAAASQLERVKLVLDRQSPVSFRMWLLAPWLFPRRIGSTLPGRTKQSSSLEN